MGGEDVSDQKREYIHTSHMFRVIYDCLSTCNFNFFFVFSCFSCDRTIIPVIGICGGEQHVCLATLPPSYLHAAFSWTRPFST